ncbi:MAG: hypothetical protein ACHQ52_05095 [Candidatus Eisenbacteria bacterium]
MITSIHRPSPVRAVLATLAVVAAATTLGGCSKSLSKEFLPDQAPTVRLTHAPVSSTSREVYAYRMDWVGYDPDGRVDHFLYAIDPKDEDLPDTSWITTTKNEEVIYFKAPVPDEPVPTGNAYASEFHVFSIRAVDNQGMQSKTVSRAFFAYTAAPVISIQTPTPNQDGQIVTPSVRITWAGTDPDGLTGKPIQYKFRLFPSHNPDFPAIPDFIQFATANRDSFRRLYAPLFDKSDHCPSCTAWDSLPPDTTDIQFTDLVPKQQYLFVVTGFDDAGAYDPIWRTDKNMLLLKVSYAGTLGPIITMFNEFFNYRYPTGGSPTDPSRYVNVEFPADRLITINWFADPPPGAAMRRYRWVMDLLELDDETPRSGPDDWYHWSAWGLTNTSATVGPFDPTVKPDHLFFIEAEDNNGLLSIGIIHFTVVRPSFNNELLVVRDLRAFAKDQFTKGPGGVLQLNPPTGAWPSRAELDTFMFAHGGAPWRGYPAGTVTMPGVFAGYHYDTLSTYQYITGVTPLSTLGQYKHVLWWTDQNTAGLDRAPTDQVAGMSSLRYMSGPNHSSTIATYVKQGGTVWLSGGGAALATLLDWNKRGSDPSIYSATDLELVPGRYMFDIAHWQSELRISSALLMKANFNIAPFKSTTPSRGWGGGGGKPTVGKEPNYGLMNTTGILSLDLRDPSYPDDPVPPLRSPNDWYVTVVPAEVITVGDFIREAISPDGNGPQFSTLDTLYVALGGPAGPNRPSMTYYHGREGPAAADSLSHNVFSGFPIWDFRRVQQIALVDFVLQELWGLTRDPVSRDPMLVRAHAAPQVRVVPTRPIGPGRLSRTTRE